MSAATRTTRVLCALLLAFASTACCAPTERSSSEPSLGQMGVLPEGPVEKRDTQ